MRKEIVKDGIFCFVLFTFHLECWSLEYLYLIYEIVPFISLQKEVNYFILTRVLF